MGAGASQVRRGPAGASGGVADEVVAEGLQRPGRVGARGGGVDVAATMVLAMRWWPLLLAMPPLPVVCGSPWPPVCR